MYKVSSKITLSDTDAAGILYFSNIFVKAHEAYEELLADMGIDLNNAIKNKEYSIPIVHAEADYKSPLVPGDVVDIYLYIGNIGESSFTLDYDFYRDDNITLAAKVKTVHATIDKKKANQKYPSLKDSGQDSLIINKLNCKFLQLSSACLNTGYGYTIRIIEVSYRDHYTGQHCSEFTFEIICTKIKSLLSLNKSNG
ncbi:acyl-CoA thioesterase [candidate division KSB1 bacterium]